MKKANYCILFILLFMLNIILTDISYSQWTLAGSITNPGLRPVISAADQNNVWCAGGRAGIPKIFRATNGGLNWTSESANGIFTELLCIWAKDAGTVFAGDAGINGKARFYRTTNAGLNWIVLDILDGPTASINGVKFSESMPLFGIAISGNIDGCGSSNFIYKTKDGGFSWTKKELAGYSGAATSINSLVVIDSLFYGFGTTMCLPSIVITTDGGLTWNLRNIGIPSINESITSGIAFSSNKLTGIAESSSLPLVMRTSNGGLNWEESYSGFDISGNCIMRWVLGTDNCYLSGTHAPSGAILKSTNGGLNWIQMTTVNSGISNFDIKKTGNSIFGYAVTYVSTKGQKVRILKLKDNISRESESKSLFSTEPLENDLSESNTSPGENQNKYSGIPDEFRLYQNYPNPFNPVTNLEFGISDLGFVSLKVYDVRGKEVATLVNSVLSAGTYKYDFEGSNLSSGVYFYKLEADGFVDTKRMYLVK